MRIGIDAYITSPGQAGFTNYITRIVEHLARIQEDELLVYAPSMSAVAVDGLARLPGVTVRPVDFDPSSFSSRTDRDTTWHQQALLGALRKDRPDVCFGTCQFLPLEWEGPSVVTVHDLIFERHPEFFTPENQALYATWTRRSTDRADAIITVSEATAADVRQIWGVHDKPVVAAPLASALSFVPSDRERSRCVVAEHVGIDGPYILSVAAGHRRKNLRGAVAACASLPADLRLLLVNVDIGPVHDLVREHGIEDRTVVTGRLPEDLIPDVYKAAAVLLHPSFYEGFGLPVLEAMTCGTPVVASNRPAIPEIAGDAAILVDPEDRPALARALDQVSKDDQLWRQLSAAGRRRSRQFSWAATAKTTREVLAQACGLEGSG